MLTLETVDFSDYDIIHIHGIPHYGILEHLDKIKETLILSIVSRFSKSLLIYILVVDVLW